MNEEADDLTALEEARDKTTSDFVSGLKERESLKKELEEKTKALNHVKGQNYDLMKKLDDLEKKLAEMKTESKPQTKRPKSSAMSKKRVSKRKVPRKEKAKDTLSPDAAGTHEDVFETQEKLYQAIAAKYPELSISTVLMAEKKFADADADRSGTIDATELEKILDNSTLVFTKAQVADIFNSIDKDKTGSVDFFECLEVLDGLRNNRRTDLPVSLQRNKSSVCTIQ